MKRLVLVLAAVLGVAAAVGVLRSRVAVPEGSVAVVPGTPPRILSPGTHWVPPGKDREFHAAGPRRLEFDSRVLSDYRIFARDTTELEVTLWAEADLSAEGLTRLLQEGGRPDQAMETILRAGVRAWARERTSDLLLEASGTADGRRGLRRGIEALLPRTPGVRWTLGEVRFSRAAVDVARRARDRAASTGRRVLLVGIDSADWTLIDPLFAQGELPHLRSLVDRGARGSLESIVPLLSPLIWTTIATGVSPERHGVLDFVSRNPDGSVVPVGSADRRVPAIWNLVSAWDKTVSVIGWLATWPAETVNGTLVTDRFGFLGYVQSGGPGSRTEGMTWPPELAERAAPYRISPEGLTIPFLDRFVDVPQDSLRAGRSPGFRKGKLINNMVHTLTAAETTRRLGLTLWTEDEPDLGLFYFEMVDAMGHLFMPYAPPRLPWIEAPDVAAYGNAVRESYRYQDEILGDFLKVADDSTLVVVVSDHGFKSGESRPRAGSQIGEAGAAHWHTRHGVIVLAGPGVNRGAVIPDPTVYDVAPTLLAYLGIPPPAEMEGRVLREAFSLDLPFPLAPETSEPEPLDTVAPASEQASSWNNLGLRHLSSGDAARAVEAFTRALELDPGLVTARNNLGIALMRLRRYPEAREILERTVEQDPAYSSGWLNLGLCLLGMQEPQPALEALDRARELDPENPRILRNLGFAAMETRDFARAREAFERSLRGEDRASARYGLGTAWLELGDRERARQELQRALALDPAHERARQLLERLSGG